jgi:hypothetical protein
MEYYLPWTKNGHRMHYHNRMLEHHREAAEAASEPSAKALHQHEQWRHYLKLHSAHRRAAAKTVRKLYAKKKKSRKSRRSDSSSDASSDSDARPRKSRRSRRSRRSRKSARKSRR